MYVEARLIFMTYVRKEILFSTTCFRRHIRTQNGHWDISGEAPFSWNLSTSTWLWKQNPSILDTIYYSTEIHCTVPYGTGINDLWAFLVSQTVALKVRYHYGILAREGVLFCVSLHLGFWLCASLISCTVFKKEREIGRLIINQPTVKDLITIYYYLTITVNYLF